MTMVTENDVPLSSWSQTAARRALALARAEGGREALDWAVGQLRGTVVRGSVLDNERAPLLADLATALRIRFDRDNSPGDLAEAIMHLRTVLGSDSAGGRLLPDDERARCLRELGWDFEERYALNHRLADLGEAAECYRQASELAEAAMPELYASCLVAWGRVLMRLFRYDDAREKLSQGVAAYTALGLSGHDTARVASQLLTELDSIAR
jgi:tetratricopeptide (TPR) repeat protein